MDESPAASPFEPPPPEPPSELSNGILRSLFCVYYLFMQQTQSQCNTQQEERTKNTRTSWTHVHVRYMSSSVRLSVVCLCVVCL